MRAHSNENIDKLTPFSTKSSAQHALTIEKKKIKKGSKEMLERAKKSVIH